VRAVEMRARLDDVPLGERLEVMREVARAAMVATEFRVVCEGEYRAALHGGGFGAVRVAAMELRPVLVRRTVRSIAEDDQDLLKLTLVHGEGLCVVEQGRRQAGLRAGDLALYDARRPYDMLCGAGDEPIKMMCFLFPPTLLPLGGKGIRELLGAPIPSTPGLGDLTAQFLMRLAENVDHFSPAEGARLATAALEVLATRLARELDITGWGTSEERRHALLTTVQGFVLQRLGDPRLGPAEVAAAHHMSLRSLHQLFNDHGLTVGGWIRSRRMEACRRDLADPALADRPVGAIGTRWGFASTADFSRAFRLAHAMTPLEYRNSAREAKGPTR